MSAEIHNITESMPHNAGPARCIACKHEWVAVAPQGLDFFECPRCGCEKGTFKGPCQREGLHWTCTACAGDCQIFYLTDTGPYCVNCGKWADWAPRPPLRPVS